MYEYTPFYRIPEWMNRTKWMQRGGSLFILSPMAFAICSGHNLIARWPDRCGWHRCNVIESPEETLHIHQRTEYVAKLDERHVIWIISCKFFVFFIYSSFSLLSCIVFILLCEWMNNKKYGCDRTRYACIDVILTFIISPLSIDPSLSSRIRGNDIQYAYEWRIRLAWFFTISIHEQNIYWIDHKINVFLLLTFLDHFVQSNKHLMDFIRIHGDVD